MHGDGLFPDVVLRVGPVMVAGSVLYCLIVSAVLIAFALLVRLGLKRRFAQE
jgi:hypothetical protein